MTTDPIETAHRSVIAAVIHEHAADIGKVAISWNGANETLAWTFVHLVTRYNTALGYAAWGSLKSDRAQREMLQSGLLAALEQHDPKLWGEYSWALNLFNGLEDRRNNIVHAPYGLMLESTKFEMFPDTSTGNRRAANMAGKNFKLECKNLVQTLDDLRRFIRELSDHLHTDPKAHLNRELPARPKVLKPEHQTKKQSPEGRQK